MPALEVSAKHAYSLQKAQTELLKTPKDRVYVEAYFNGSSSSDNATPLTYGVLATRDWCIERVKTFPFDSYLQHRDDCEQNCTLLSPHLKFGIVSPRELAMFLTRFRGSEIKLTS